MSTHSGLNDHTACQLIYKRDIKPRLPTETHRMRVLDIGCGQGTLVKLMREDGLDAWGVDISEEQVDLARAEGTTQIFLADLQEFLENSESTWDVVVANDILEHLQKQAVLDTFDRVHKSLTPGGIFLARVPNAVSPVGGHVMYGDITHETWFTRRNVAQLAAVSGFDSIETFPCPPPAHGLKSCARLAAWKVISGLFKLALTAETGQLRGHVVTQNLTFVAHKSSAGVARDLVRDLDGGSTSSNSS